MINDLNRWTVGWIDWNLLLDAEGGPNHVGNLCSAPVLADVHEPPGGAEWLHQSLYFYIGHFARFIQLGSQRVLCAATRQALECTAFANPDGTNAVVAMNRGEAPLAFRLQIDGVEMAFTLPPRSIATFFG